MTSNLPANPGHRSSPNQISPRLWLVFSQVWYVAHTICHRVNPRALSAICAALFGPLLTLIVCSFAISGTLSLTLPLLSYLVALSSSVVLYRISPFHPLACYPGPVLARVSGFWALWKAVDGRQHVLYRRLHEKYGEVVRTGPNHLHICNAGAIHTVLGAREHKPDGYEIPLPPGHIGSVLTLTDPAAHGARKRVWEKAFTRAALHHYQPMFASRRAEFKAAMDQRCGAVVNISEWVAFFTLDFMGDFALGGMFDFMAQGGDAQGFHRTLIRAMGLTDLCSKVSWVRNIVHPFPGPLDSFLMAVRNIARKRQGTVADHRDLFYYLLGDSDEVSEPPTTDSLAQDALVAVIAGSDTSSMILVNAVFYLMAHPRALATLRIELDEAMAVEDEVEWGVLAECRYLQAVINETMRLAPVLPNGPPRTPPPNAQSVTVSGHVVPKDTIVYIPFYSLFRDVRYFAPDPDLFRPERWLGGGPGDVLDRSAFIPFSYGPTACAGRQLAQHEVRDMLALLVRRYDFAFAPGYDPARWEEDWEDRYVLVPGPLPVVLTRRQV